MGGTAIINCEIKAAYRRVGDEIKNQDFEPECLSKALEESSGDYNLAMSIYVKKRVDDLKAQFHSKNLRTYHFQTRKQQAAAPFTGYVFEQAHTEWTDWMTIIIGHFCLILASYGAIWAGSIYLGQAESAPLNPVTILIIHCANLLPAIAYLSVKNRLPFISYTKVLMTCVTMACLISFGLGILLLKKL